MRRILNRLSRRFFPPTSVTIEGYENPELIDAIVKKTAAYIPSERLDIGDARTVLDFGGGSGRHYKEAGSLARWAVVETPAMVSQARALETEQLRFFETVQDAASWLGPVDLMHSNGAIQYTEDPMRAVEALVYVRAKEMRWFRLHISEERIEDSQVSFLNDNGPGAIIVGEKLVRYPRKAIAERDFLLAHSQYHLVESGPDWFIFRV